MSPSRVPNYKKRRIDFDTSDSSDDDSPPLKLKRLHAYHPNVPLRIRNQLVKFVDWISSLPLKGYFKSAIQMAAQIPENPIVIDDDDDDEEEEDEITVINERSGENQSTVCEPRPNPFASRFKDLSKPLDMNNFKMPNLQPSGRLNSLKNNYSLSTNFGNPLSSSTPNSFLENKLSSRINVHNQQENSHFSQKLTNGAVSGDKKGNQMTQANHGKPLDWKCKPNGIKHSAVTNPNTDIEILYEYCKKSAKEPNEIEILSEIPKSAQCTIPCKKLPSRTLRVCNSPPENSVLSASSDSSSRQEQSLLSSCTRNYLPYTAHTVVRLQEKEQYRWLLEHWMRNGSHYQPAVNKPQLHNAEVQTDLSDEPVVINHFKKEVLKQPIDRFLKKYYRPCQLVSPAASSDSGSQKKQMDEPDSKEAEDDGDVQVVEIRLPKYVPKYRQKFDAFSPEWIEELKITVNAETEERLAIVQEQERELERYREERLREKLKLSGAAVCELEEDILPDITAEMEEVIENSLRSTTANDRLCSLNNQFHILRKDMDTLAGLNWLNDEVINYYLALIVQRSKENNNLPSVYAFNSFFYPSLKSKGYSAVRRWTRKVDIFAHDINLIPLHLGVHWCLAIIDHRSKKIRYYDSMGSGEDQCVEVLRDYLIDERKDKKGELLDPNSYTMEIVKPLPQQMNGSDCGMFTLKYAEYITRDAKITFTQKEMQYFRRRMMYELLTNTICE